MQTMDGMFQAGAINSSQMFYAYRDGLKLGKTGGELNEYVMGRLKAAQELFINKSQKVLNIITIYIYLKRNNHFFRKSHQLLLNQNLVSYRVFLNK